MSKKTVIHDVCNVVMKRKSDGKVIATAEAQTTSLSQSIQEDYLKGGWGNKNLFQMKSDKNITGAIKNAFFSLDWLAMQQGVKVENGTVQVWEDETLTVESDGKVTLSKTPVDTISFENSEGESYLMETETTEGQLPTTFAKEGAKVKARYKIDAEGEIVEIKADTFSEAYEMEYHTLEYDPETETIHSDLYIQFDKISPSGEAELNFEAGNAITPEIKFTALAVDNSLGRFIRVKRKADGSKGEKPTESPKQSVDLGGASA
ncbi:hypothetical protein P8917_10960 [Bacillus atrophaeus]|uniref:hypothetical protein n=1 Tax=Bacillus atrophaeus TaxID=1452 RepID=UPI00227E8B8A|nr:hypothetical protein [Bacillus atrophaeus]MCY8467233.1 hypothetical protein [Bacillus atrophaeus]MCY8476414.1 hypothetical protein [Bacillus atrophaeus]MCY8495939.1 hypothetical protein [Bacillus atrophaeus]MCY8814283.1 hypothetical protein [Bacillus atrophaeus]MCY8822114.1 hypothetical protein [Bacillus atrophaeus]